jgi:hypothetical protein
MTTPNRRYKGLLLDFGGVITTDFFASIDDHLQRLGLPRGHFRQLVTTDPAGRALYQRLERGEISQSDFESQLAALLRVEPDGLIAGMLQGSELTSGSSRLQRGRGRPASWWGSSPTRGGPSPSTRTPATIYTSGTTR